VRSTASLLSRWSRTAPRSMIALLLLDTTRAYILGISSAIPRLPTWRVRPRDLLRRKALEQNGRKWATVVKWGQRRIALAISTMFGRHGMVFW